MLHALRLVLIFGSIAMWRSSNCSYIFYLVMFCHDPCVIGASAYNFVSHELNVFVRYAEYFDRLSYRSRKSSLSVLKLYLRALVRIRR